MLEYRSASNFELKERARNVEHLFNCAFGVKYTKYQIGNKHDPTVKFSFCNAESKIRSAFQFKITIMKNRMLNLRGEI